MSLPAPIEANYRDDYERDRDDDPTSKEGYIDFRKLDFENEGYEDSGDAGDADDEMGESAEADNANVVQIIEEDNQPTCLKTLSDDKNGRLKSTQGYDYLALVGPAIQQRKKK